MAIVVIVVIVAIEAIVDGGLARVGSLALAYLRGTDGGSFAIYIMCGVFGEGLPLHARGMYLPVGEIWLRIWNDWNT